MSEYDNTNRGQIWKNDDRKTETHPQFKGTVNVEGVEYWVSAWSRKPDANPKAPALSFSIKKKEDKVETTIDTDVVAQDSFDDTIPF
jgi:hypothetical protein